MSCLFCMMRFCFACQKVGGGSFLGGKSDWETLRSRVGGRQFVLFCFKSWMAP